MKVAKWGNSLAIRLPVDAVQALGLKDGDEVEISVSNDRHLMLARKKTREEILDDLQASLKGTMPVDFKFDREEANARR